MYIKLRRDTVGKEVIYFAIGVTEDGYREILGFYVGLERNASRFVHRGVQEVLLGVFDGLPGLEEAFLSVYPKADVQRCVIHKVRNTLNHVRQKDQYEIAEDLKAIYKSFTKEAAFAQFEHFQSSHRSIRRKSHHGNNLPVLLTFLDYPSSIRSVIYTTNWIERTIKDIRTRIRHMNSCNR